MELEQTTFSMVDACQRERPSKINKKTIVTKRRHWSEMEIYGGKTYEKKKIFVRGITVDIKDADLSQYFSRDDF